MGKQATSAAEQTMEKTRMLEIDTSQNTAEYLQVSDSWMRQARMNGVGPEFFKLGKLVRYRKGDVDAWIEGKRKQNTITIS